VFALCSNISFNFTPSEIVSISADSGVYLQFLAINQEIEDLDTCLAFPAQ
jgi:hypothetical protein